MSHPVTRLVLSVRDFIFVYCIMRYMLHIHYENTIEVSALLAGAGYFERDAVDKVTQHAKRIVSKSPVVIVRRSKINKGGE